MFLSLKEYFVYSKKLVKKTKQKFSLNLKSVVYHNKFRIT